MQIPPFTQPSNPSIEHLFRMPQVKDAMSWSNASPDTEEANVTRYLREMLLPGQNSDPITWTVQDHAGQRYGGYSSTVVLILPLPRNMSVSIASLPQVIRTLTFVIATCPYLSTTLAC
jgi:hypothetical protein